MYRIGVNKLSGNKGKNDHDGVKFKIESPTTEIKKNSQRRTPVINF